MNNHLFPQDQPRLCVVGLILTVLLSACGNTTPTPSAESILSGVQTAVAATVPADAVVPATPTATLLPTVTPAEYLVSTATSVSATATSYNWYWSYPAYYSCEDSAFVKDMTIPDGTVLAPGETFVKTWRFKNTGSCTWTDYYSIVFVDGDDMDGSDTAIDLAVRADKKADVSVELTAPDDEGTYTGYWTLADENGYAFGETVYVSIVVSGDAITSTPTATSTATSIPTPTSDPAAAPSSTPTAQPTDTPTPADSPTEIPTATVPDTSTPTPVPVITDTPVPTVPPTDIPTATPAE